MREEIKFGLIRTEEELDGLIEFAKSFDHKVGRDSFMPIFTINFGKQLIGYFNVIRYPILCPAMHPELSTPRIFYDVIHLLKGHFCLNSIDNLFWKGTCLIAVPRDLAFSRDIFERCGFMRTNKELWQAIP